MTDNRQLLSPLRPPVSARRPIGLVLKRRLSLGILGGCLILGFFLPVPGGSQARLNMSTPLEKDLISRVMAWASHPVVVGVVAILLSLVRPGRLRGILLAAFLLLPACWELSSLPSVLDALHRPAGSMPLTVALLLIAWMYLAHLLMWVGGLVTLYRPDGRIAGPIAAIGALFLCFALFLPVFPPRGATPIDSFLQITFSRPPSHLALPLVLLVGLHGASIVLAFLLLLFNTRKVTTRSSMALAMCGTLLWGYFIVGLAFVNVIGAELASPPLMVAKILLIGGCATGLLVAGLVDVVLGAERQANPGPVHVAPPAWA